MSQDQEEAPIHFEETKGADSVRDARSVATSGASPAPSRGGGTSALSTDRASAARARSTAADMIAKATFRPSVDSASRTVAGAALDRVQRALDTEDGEVILPAGFMRASELGSPPKPPVDVVHEADVDSEGEESEHDSS